MQCMRRGWVAEFVRPRGVDAAASMPRGSALGGWGPGPCAACETCERVGGVLLRRRHVPCGLTRCVSTYGCASVSSAVRINCDRGHGLRKAAAHMFARAARPLAGACGGRPPGGGPGEPRHSASPAGRCAAAAASRCFSAASAPGGVTRTPHSSPIFAFILPTCVCVAFALHFEGNSMVDRGSLAAARAARGACEGRQGAASGGRGRERARADETKRMHPHPRLRPPHASEPGSYNSDHPATRAHPAAAASPTAALPQPGPSPRLPRLSLPLSPSLSRSLARARMRAWRMSSPIR
jgi:hypothetical protein